MKQIKITYKHGTQIELTGSNLHYTDDRLYFDNHRGEREAINTEGKVIEIKEAPEEKDWCVVVGIASKAVYTLSKDSVAKTRQVILKDNLTEKEADEIAYKIERSLKGY